MLLHHRTRRPLSLGDCFLLAMTGYGEELATADPHLLDTAVEERVDRIVLPDSRGLRHTPRRSRQ